eukprot:scaffold135340_cov145-Phaeocystis_antarctica.AAC.1
MGTYIREISAIRGAEVVDVLPCATRQQDNRVNGNFGAIRCRNPLSRPWRVKDGAIEIGSSGRGSHPSVYSQSISNTTLIRTGSSDISATSR